jgi:hypothetical protein
MVLRNPALSTNVFCIDAKGVVDTSQALDSLKVAFWTTGSDTAYVSYPPYPTIASYDSLRLNTQLLNTNVGDSQPVSMRIYKGEFSDTMSMFTDTTVYIQRQIGRFTNDAMRVPNMVYPKTVIGVHECVPPQRPQHGRLRSPCRAADLVEYIHANGRKVEVRDVAGRECWPGNSASLPSGVYLLRFSQEPKHTEEIVLQRY